MASKRLLDYLVTERGRQFTLKVVACTGMAMFSVQYLPNTVGISKFREFVQAYK